MRRGSSILAAAAAALVVAATGCLPSAGPAPRPQRAKARPASCKNWSEAEISKDLVAYAEAAIQETAALIAKLQKMEEKRETSRQNALRQSAELAKNEAAARQFGRTAKPVYDNPATIYPVSVAGGSFPSREALRTELTAAKRTIDLAVKNKPVLANQVAREEKDLSEIRKCLAQYAARKYDLERKADAARTAMAERDLEAIKKLAGELFDVVNAALPDNEILGPPVNRLGDDGGESELEGFVF